MEKSNNFKFRLGLFVITGLALFAAAIFFIGKQQHLFNTTFRLSTTFGNISGLQVGNNIRFSGINVGTVDKVEILTDTSVLVEMIIDQAPRKFIKKDSYATIGTEGLMGDKVITITQGSAAAGSIEDGDRLQSSDPIETDDIIASLKISGENAEIVTGQLAEILYKINNGEGTLGRLISDTTIATNLQQTIANLKQGSKGLNQNMEAAKHNVLLRGYFRKKKKEAEQKKQESLEKSQEKDTTK